MAHARAPQPPPGRDLAAWWSYAWDASGPFYERHERREEAIDAGARALPGDEHVPRFFVQAFARAGESAARPLGVPEEVPVVDVDVASP